MNGIWNRSLAAAMTLLAMACSTTTVGALPEPATDTPKASTSSQATAVFAGGCFWGVEAVFKHVKGVSTSTSGYAGGNVENPYYELVSSGNTGHAESVQVDYDASQVTCTVSAADAFSRRTIRPSSIARGRIGAPNTVRRFSIRSGTGEGCQGVYTQLDAAKTFSQTDRDRGDASQGLLAEDYHQNYLALHPDQPYIVINDMPKLASLKSELAESFTSRNRQEAGAGHQSVKSWCLRALTVKELCARRAIAGAVIPPLVFGFKS